MSAGGLLFEMPDHSAELISTFFHFSKLGALNVTSYITTWIFPFITFRIMDITEMLLLYDRYKVTFILTFCDVNRDNLEENRDPYSSLGIRSKALFLFS